MNSYVVLLRGVNVGKAKRVPMADLKALANIDTLHAVQASAEAGQRQAQSPELHHLQAA